MARAEMTFLSNEEIRRIHDTSIRVLEEVGVVVNSKGVCDMLVAAGLERTKDGKRLLIPESIVRSSLASAPKSLLLASADRKKDIRIPSEDKLYAANGGEGIYVKDLVTSDSHPSRTEDLRDFAILVESLPQIDFFWPMVGALEAPAHLKGLFELKTCLEFTSKHVQLDAHNADVARHMVRLASILTGGPEALAKRPIISCSQCPISPLSFEAGLVEGQVEEARAGIPVVAMSAAVAGLTSPVTLSGTLAQVNAEGLASLVITQIARKGAPWIYSSDSSAGNLKTGSIDYEALESVLLRTGSGQMGRFYGLPTMTAGISLEEVSTTLARVSEGVGHMMTQALVPSDLASGLGGIDNARGASFEQLLVDAWVWDIARELIRTFETNDAAISFETIRDAGLDGNFLGKRHTLDRFRGEFVSSRKPEAMYKGKIEDGERGALIKKARQEARAILSRPKIPVLPKDKVRMLDEYLRNVSRASL